MRRNEGTVVDVIGSMERSGQIFRFGEWSCAALKIMGPANACSEEVCAADTAACCVVPGSSPTISDFGGLDSEDPIWPAGEDCSLHEPGDKISTAFKSALMQVRDKDLD